MLLVTVQQIAEILLSATIALRMVIGHEITATPLSSLAGPVTSLLSRLAPEHWQITAPHQVRIDVTPLPKFDRRDSWAFVVVGDPVALGDNVAVVVAPVLQIMAELEMMCEGLVYDR